MRGCHCTASLGHTKTPVSAQTPELAQGWPCPSSPAAELCSHLGTGPRAGCGGSSVPSRGASSCFKAACSVAGSPSFLLPQDRIPDICSQVVPGAAEVWLQFLSPWRSPICPGSGRTLPYCWCDSFFLPVRNPKEFNHLRACCYLLSQEMHFFLFRQDLLTL